MIPKILNLEKWFTINNASNVAFLNLMREDGKMNVRKASIAVELVVLVAADHSEDRSVEEWFRRFGKVIYQ